MSRNLGFCLELRQRMNYDMLAKRVAGHLDTDPYLLQLLQKPEL